MWQELEDKQAYNVSLRIMTTQSGEENGPFSRKMVSLSEQQMHQKLKGWTEDPPPRYSPHVTFGDHEEINQLVVWWDLE